jgi:arsenate reductase-like glutaredoxin family protein
MRAARPDAFRNHTMPQTITLFHNPRCSKSRAALELLTARGVVVEVVEYLKTPPSRDTLAAIVAKLGIDAGDLIRRGEDVFKGDHALARRPLDAGEASDPDGASERRSRGRRVEVLTALNHRDTRRVGRISDEVA